MSREARRRRAAKREAARRRPEGTSRSSALRGLTEAVCEDCCFHFATTQQVGFVGTGGAEVRQVWIGCPRCGGRAVLRNPAVERADSGRTTLIAGNPEALSALREIVEQLHGGRLTADEAADAIEARLPGLRKLAAWIRANHMAIAAWAAVVIAVLAYVQDDQSMTPEDLSDVIEQVVNQATEGNALPDVDPKGDPAEIFGKVGSKVPSSPSKQEAGPPD